MERFTWTACERGSDRGGRRSNTFWALARTTDALLSGHAHSRPIRKFLAHKRQRELSIILQLKTTTGRQFKKKHKNNEIDPPDDRITQDEFSVFRYHRGVRGPHTLRQVSVFQGAAHPKALCFSGAVPALNKAFAKYPKTTRGRLR